MSKEIAEEYASSLADLTVNSKPLINMLTILAEENIDHAGVIVETVEKHLEKVHSDIKLPVLYLVDSIIKNVGGAYTQKFSQIIVNMFTRTFKQVDEKVRSQMFKLRETWHDVFPATKLYQLDVKVNLIDPAWPIQAQPQQSNIHVNPNFLKKPAATSSTNIPTTTIPSEEEKMRNILAKKEQELLMLQQKKVEMELEQTRRQLEIAGKSVNKVTSVPQSVVPAPVMPIAMVNPVVAPAQVPQDTVHIPVKQRLGPPVNKVSSGARIAPVSGALATARRDPRLARHVPPARPSPPASSPLLPVTPIAPNVFDIKPLDRVIKRKNVITIDVRPDAVETRPQPRRRDPRLEKRNDDRKTKRDLKERERKKEEKREDKKVEEEKNSMDSYLEQIPDVKKINKLPPIPKINRDEPRSDSPASTKRRKEIPRIEKKKKRDNTENSKDSSSNSSPEKKSKNKIRKLKPKDTQTEVEEKQPEQEVVTFKELKNYHKERYMRRNKEKSESPINTPDEKEEQKPVEPSSVADVAIDSKDVDLRVLHAVVPDKAAIITQKRPSTETLEGKAKKNKLEKFDILFGNEDVDLRQLPQVDEVLPPPPPTITDSPKKESKPEDEASETEKIIDSPQQSPKKDWNEVKEKEVIRKPSELDVVRAKLAVATKSKDKDRLGRPLLYSNSPNAEKERDRRRTISSEDIDLREDDTESFDTEDNKKTISIIMTQAKQQFSDGELDKNQYNTLMYQVLQISEKMKLKEAKQRESLEISKRKLKAHIEEENHKVPTPKSSPNERNTFGDIDERVTPSVFMDTPPDSQGFLQDSDMRMTMANDGFDAPKKGLLPLPPVAMYMNSNSNLAPFPPLWRGQSRPRLDEYSPRRRGTAPPFYRAKFDKRGIRPFEPRLQMPQIPPLPTPQMGMCQGEYPLLPYKRLNPPLPLGSPGINIPPTDVRVLEFIDQDPVKTIQIDGIPREIRFYGDTAVIMMNWDDPREIKFLPGSRRVTFDNKDSVVVSFNEGYKQVEIDDQTFDIRFGAPTRELYINGRWFECFFGGQPIGVLIDGKPRLIHLEPPLPQVDIGKVKRMDLCAGKINLIVDAMHMCPIFLDAKVQKFTINGNFFTIRFVDALRTVLINEVPFEVEFGGLPKPIFIGNTKHFIRFSVLPRHVKPGYMHIANMEGQTAMTVQPSAPFDNALVDNVMEIDEPVHRPIKTPSPDGMSQGLDMLASVMPSTMAPSSASEYTSEPFFGKTDKIPGLETPLKTQEKAEEKPNPDISLLSNINVNDLFAKLVATGIVKVSNELPVKEDKEERLVEEKKLKEDKNSIHRVDLLRSETLRVKQLGLVSRLYGGMQCSGCGARFPPEHTVRYSQHLDWHFRQNRRDRDSARRAHSRHWHYDMADWLQYEELEDLEERERSWFETGGNEGEGEAPPEPGEEASVAAGAVVDQHCALCGDKFDQFYNEDKEEWHLRNAEKHDDKNYHPLCFKDYKASLAKEETPMDLSEEPEIITPVEKIEESSELIEIKDVDDTIDQSDNESVIEVVESEEKESEPVEIEEEGDEDDVVFKAEPVEQVVVGDDDTDDETSAERAERDRLAEIDFSKVKVKQEPIDPDDEPIITAEEEPIAPTVDITQPTVTSSIDGNLQLEATPTPPTTVPFGGIRINISKTLAPTSVNNHNDKLDDVSVDDEPLPPGEEPDMEYKIKPSMEGVHFGKQPPVQKGSELSALCSIM